MAIHDALAPFFRAWWERGDKSGPVFPVPRGKRTGEEKRTNSHAKRLRRELFRAGVVRVAPSRCPRQSRGTRTDLGKAATGTKLAPNPRDPLYFEGAGVLAEASKGPGKHHGPVTIQQPESLLAPKTRVIPVGAIGFEPTTPTVSSRESSPARGEGRETTSSPSPLGPLGAPRDTVANAVANDEAALRAEIERLQAQLAALRPPLRRVK